MQLFRFSVTVAITAIAFNGIAFAERPKATGAELDFAHQMESAINNKNPDVAKALFDPQALLDRVEAGIAAAPKTKQDFEPAGPSFCDSLFGSLTAGVKEGNEFKFIGMNLHDGQKTAVFRMILPSGTDYIEMFLHADNAGALRAIDTYDLARGAMTSEALRRFYLGMVLQQDKAAAAKLGATERALVDNINALQTMTEDARAGKYQEAVDVYKTLPEPVQHDKTALYLRVTCLDQLGAAVAADYTAAIADCRKYFPNDPALDFLSLDHLLQQKDWKAAHAAIGRLMAYTGEDANWHFMDGNIYTMTQQKADEPAAIAAYNKAMEVEPAFDKPYWSVMAIYLKNKDNARIEANLRAIVKNTGEAIAYLSTLPDYADFVKSPEYQDWLKTQKKAGKQ